MLHVPGLYIQHSLSKGRCVYTSETLSTGDIIEICPIIKILESEMPVIRKTIFHDYYFVWEEDGYSACLALGYGSLYNHHSNANAEILLDYTDSTIQIIAVKEVIAGTEILINYTGGIKGSTPLWFESVE